MASGAKVGRISDWPDFERPRERLFELGINALSDAELLALFLRSGTKGENVRDLSLRLIQEFKGLKGLAKADANALTKVKGLGPAKISCLMAAFEIGNRINREKMADKPIIESAEDILPYVKPHFYKADSEIFLALLLNAKNKLEKIITLSNGDATNLIISIPQTIRRLVLEGYPSVIFVHNHPSGDTTPSDNDIDFTEKLVQACEAVQIHFHDHIIVGDEGYFSFSEEDVF